MPDVLIVDGDDHYREVLSANLIALGFSVMCFAKGPSLLEALSSGMEAKVALLEWALPEMSGFELLDTLRKSRIGLPVVFLTAYSQVERELQALDRGAVDFVDKARGIEVLVHRLRLIMNGQRQIPPPAMPEVERHGELALHPSMARALWLDQDVGLTIAEFNVVTLLVSSKGEIQTYRAIYDAVHFAGFIAGSGDRGYTTNVRSFVKRIRSKFLAIDPGFSAIKNVRLVGYRWPDR
ncbi:response regulator transcription factor [Reyranella soli]|nr:response regulator transcription factor [Reyranella soli]